MIRYVAVSDGTRKLYVTETALRKIKSSEIAYSQFITFLRNCGLTIDDVVELPDKIERDYWNE